MKSVLIAKFKWLQYVILDGQAIKKFEGNGDRDSLVYYSASTDFLFIEASGDLFDLQILVQICANSCKSSHRLL